MVKYDSPMAIRCSKGNRESLIPADLQFFTAIFPALGSRLPTDFSEQIPSRELASGTLHVAGASGWRRRIPFCACSLLKWQFIVDIPIWLVLWLLSILFSHINWVSIIIPIDEVIFFQRGG